MTDDDKLLALFKELDGVRWTSVLGDIEYRLTWEMGLQWWRRWWKKRGDKPWSLFRGGVASHEAFCLMQDELLRRLREKWSVEIILPPLSDPAAPVVVNLYGWADAANNSGIVSEVIHEYEGPTALDAYFAAAEGEL